jgi:LysM repeat protein
MKILCRCTLLLLTMMLIFPAGQAWPSREPTARLRFERIGGYPKQHRQYVVRKGDTLERIVRSQFGKMSNRRMSSLYTDIQRLNPGLTDLERIQEGQTILLPGNVPGAGAPPVTAGTPYMVKKGDTLTKILTRDFGVTERYAPASIRQIRRLNPSLANPDRIRIGEVLYFPQKPLPAVKEGKAEARPEKEAAVEIPKAKPAEAPAPSVGRIETIRQIVRACNGQLTTRGQYILPLSRGGQMTIDCTSIPVVEFSDGSLILIDFAKRLPEKNRKLITTGRKRYAIASLLPEEPLAESLQKIFDASRTYRMTKRSQPLVLNENPQVVLRADWQVSETKQPASEAKQSPKKPASYALSFLAEGEAPLPEPAANISEQQGWKILEISEKTGMISAADKQDALHISPATPSGSAVDLVADLMSRLDIPTVRDKNIQIFEKGKDGFNLEIHGDLTAEYQGKRVLFNAKKMPQQFINILKQKGYEVVILDPSLSRRGAVEKAMNAVNVPLAAGDYSFPLKSSTGKTRADFRFPALKISSPKGTWYLVDFDFNPDLYPLLYRNGEVNIVRF